MERGAGTLAVSVGQQLMQPVQDATLQALVEYGRRMAEREAARRAQLAADREARRPKAYRWKDRDGTWHLSDREPTDPEAVEVIPLR